MNFVFPGGTANHIMVADELIPEELCEEFLTACKTHYSKMFSPGPTWGGVRPLVKSSQDASIEPSSLAERGITDPIFAMMRVTAEKAMHIAVSRYIQQYRTLWQWPGRSDSGFRLQHYHQGGGYYRDHADGTPWEPVASGGHKPRVLAAVIYLNTVLVGGGTHLPEQNQTVDARTGRIALFPTMWTHPHAGVTPLSSDKFIFSSFLLSETVEETPAVASEMTPFKTEATLEAEAKK